MSGMEMMIKAMGLQDAMKGVQQLIDKGAIDKVVKFADDAEEIKRDIAEMRGAITEMRDTLRALHETRYAIGHAQSDTRSADRASADGSVLRSTQADLSDGRERVEPARNELDGTVSQRVRTD